MTRYIYKRCDVECIIIHLNLHWLEIGNVDWEWRNANFVIRQSTFLFSFIHPCAISLPRFFKPDNTGYANTPWIVTQVNGVSRPMLLDSAGSANMLSHKRAKRCRLQHFPKGKIFETTDSRGRLILQGYKNVPVNVPGLGNIFTKIYEAIPNGVYNDTIDSRKNPLKNP
jgi:hypothetical protein